MAGEKILCVEDEEPMRLLLTTFLDGLGYQVTAVPDGKTALRATGEDTPDLVITDINVPDLNGLELTRRLRASRRTASIPIIVLSGQREAAAVLAGYAEGADEYVTKPVELPILGAKVEALLRRRAVAEPATRLGKVIVFLRGKGGAGATTLAVNLAVGLVAAAPSTVALLDLHLEFGNAAMLLDLKPRRTLAHMGAAQVAEIDEATLADFVVEHVSGVRLVVGSDSPERAELVTALNVQQTLARLRDQADYVLVDTPPSFSDITLAALDVADMVCLVTEAHLAALKATADCVAVLEKLQVPQNRVQLVLNHTTPKGLEDAQVVAFFRRKPDVVIPYTPSLDEAADAGRPFITTHPRNAAASAMRALAATVGAVVSASA